MQKHWYRNFITEFSDLNYIPMVILISRSLAAYSNMLWKLQEDLNPIPKYKHLFQYQRFKHFHNVY